jgi:hypothetical protein
LTPCAVSALVALAELNGDVIEFARNFPAFQRQVIGLISCMLQVGMGDASEANANNIFRDETALKTAKISGSDPRRFLARLTVSEGPGIGLPSTSLRIVAL